MYIVIQTTGDGDIRINKYSKDELTKFINDEEEGDFDTADFVTDKRLEKESDPIYWGENSILIIKGELVVPKPVKIVEQYEVE
jgi:hypothetical protein